MALQCNPCSPIDSPIHMEPGDSSICSPHTEPPCDEWYCYNCFAEGNCKVRAKEFCLDCDVSMCDKCLQQHVSFIKKKKHNMLPVGQYKLMKRKFECRQCKLHPKHTLMFVCYKCNQILCQVCVACNDCDAGGRHDVQELEVVAMELASSINQGMKDIDCVRQQGALVIDEASKVCQQSECEMEKLKQSICSQFEEKSADLCREKQKILNQINEMVCHNRKQTQCHKAQIQEILCDAKKATAKANQLLHYSHNVDIATEARCTLDELQSIKVVTFPCLELGKFTQCQAEKIWNLPAVTNDTEMKTFCPQPVIPAPAAEGELTIVTADSSTVSDGNGKIYHPQEPKMPQIENCRPTRNKKLKEIRSRDHQDSYTQYESCPEQRKRQSYTQCPSVIEPSPQACTGRRARNSWTQCDNTSIRDSACKRKSRCSPSSNKHTSLVSPCYNPCNKSAACKMKMKSKQHSISPSACFRSKLNSMNRCNNARNVKIDSEVETASIEGCQSGFQGRMAYRRDYSDLPSTSRCGSNSMTSLVNKAVLSIQSLKASLEDVKTSSDST